MWETGKRVWQTGTLTGEKSLQLSGAGLVTKEKSMVHTHTHTHTRKQARIEHTYRACTHAHTQTQTVDQHYKASVLDEENVW